MTNETSQERLIGALYSRISTAKQKDGISLDQQDHRMSLYAESNGIIVPADYHFQEQESGYKSARSDYDRIRQLVREGKIDVLIVYGSDRHTRDPIHGEIFRSELRRNKVALHIVTEGGEVDIITPTGQYMRRQMDNFNWYWGKMIQQTTMDKKKEYAEHGIPLQQGPAPFGYRRVGKQREARLEHIPEEIAIVRRIFELLDIGYSVLTVVGMMEGTPTPGDIRGYLRKRPHGVWTKGTIYQIMKDEIYAGVYYGNRYEFVEREDGRKRNQLKPREQWIRCEVPAVVSREQWERVNRALAEGNLKPAPETRKHNYLLSRLTWCRHCKLKISGHTIAKRGHAYYRCNSVAPETTVEPCALGNRRVDDADDTVWEFTRALLKEPAAMIAAMREAQRVQMEDNAELSQRISEMDDLIAERRVELETLVVSFRQAKGALLLEALQREADRIAETIAGLEQEREKLTRKFVEYVITDDDLASLERFAADVGPALDEADFALKRQIIEMMDFTFEMENDRGVTVIYVHWHSHDFTLKVGGDTSPNAAWQGGGAPPFSPRSRR
jgi:site-specific DNA recombinase